MPSDVPGKESRVCRKPVGVVAVMALGTVCGIEPVRGRGTRRSHWRG